jgi:hypothetical protein
VTYASVCLKSAEREAKLSFAALDALSEVVVVNVVHFQDLVEIKL